MTRQEVTLWSVQQVPVGSFDARAAGLGGWTLSGAHAYDPVARELVRGDGTRQGGDNVADVIDTFAGVGSPSGFGGDISINLNGTTPGAITASSTMSLINGGTTTWASESSDATAVLVS